MMASRRFLTLLLCAGLAGGGSLAVGAQCHAAATSTCCCEGAEPAASCALACEARDSNAPILAVQPTARGAFERAPLSAGAVSVTMAVMRQARSVRLAAVARTFPLLRPDLYLLDCTFRL